MECDSYHHLSCFLIMALISVILLFKNVLVRRRRNSSGFCLIVLSCSIVSQSATLWTVARQAPLCPWDFPGKSTGVGCNFLLQGIFPRDCTYVSCIGVYLYILESHLVMSNSLGPHGPYSPWNSPGQNTGVGNLSLLQGIVPTQGSNPGLPHCRQILFFFSIGTNSFFY